MWKYLVERVHVDRVIFIDNDCIQADRGNNDWLFFRRIKTLADHKWH